MRVSVIVCVFVLVGFAALCAADNCDPNVINGLTTGRVKAIRECVQAKQKAKDLKLYHRGPAQQWKDWKAVKDIHSYNLGFKASRYSRVYKAFLALPQKPLPNEQRQCWDVNTYKVAAMVRCVCHFRAKFYDALFWNKVNDRDFMRGFVRGSDLPVHIGTDLSDTYGDGVYFSNHNNFIKSHGDTLSLCSFKVLPVFSLDTQTEKGQANLDWLIQVKVLVSNQERAQFQQGSTNIKFMATDPKEFESIFEGATIEYRSVTNEDISHPLYYVVKSPINISDCRLQDGKVDVLQNNKF